MDLGVDDLALRAFKESGFPEIDAYVPAATDRAALLKRRSSVALRYSLAIAALSAALTLAGLVASLWHMAWWIGSVLLVVAALSAGLMLVVFAHAQPAGLRAGEGAEAASPPRAARGSGNSPVRNPRFEMSSFSEAMQLLKRCEV